MDGIEVWANMHVGIRISPPIGYNGCRLPTKEEIDLENYLNSINSMIEPTKDLIPKRKISIFKFKNILSCLKTKENQHNPR